MNYLLDRKLKRKRYLGGVLLVVFFTCLFYFKANIFYGLSYASSFIFRPFLVVGNNIGSKFANIPSFFITKNSFIAEVETLRSRLVSGEAKVSNYDSVVSENETLKEILGRKNEQVSMTLAAILGKPNQSPYDTLIVDIGAKHDTKTGDMVFAFGNVPIGRVDLVYDNSSKVILFSSPGEKTQVAIGATYFELVGRGAGNFEMILPRDIVLEKGEQAILPGIIPYVVGTVVTIITDPRDSFQKALLVSPINIQELKFVEIAR